MIGSSIELDAPAAKMVAENEWINGYLEAILDAGVKHRGATGAPLPLPRLPGLGEDEDNGSGSGGAAQSAAAYSPTRYFVEEVVSRFDDRDLHKTWTKVRAVFSGLVVLGSALGILSEDIELRYRWWRCATARNGITGWRTCAGGSGTSPGRRSRYAMAASAACLHAHFF